MRATLFIGTLLTLVIVGLMYKRRLKTVPAVVNQPLHGVPAPQNIQDVPKAVQQHLEGIMKKSEALKDEALQESNE